MSEERIRDYLIERQIGAGGMGMVYLAKHRNLQRHAAIKVLLENLSANPQIRERFIQEARLMGSLDHPNIVTLYDFTTEPKLSLIMEFVDGRGLDEMIGHDVGPIPWEKALPLFTQILDGIGYAHSKGIVHRDIKPANILISKEGQVKVTDLGIAKIAGQQGMTRTGTQMGTLYYESPEQIKGAKDVNRKSDIYSLGMTLYEMLAGRLPFETGGATSEFEIMNSVVHRQNNLDPREYYPHIPEWLVEIIQKATDLNPDKRFQNCDQFKQVIEKYGKLSATESTFWSGRVASVKSAPITTSRPASTSSTTSNTGKNNCPECGEAVEKEMEFCGKCGTNLQKECPNCKKTIRWYHEFCPKCGANIKEKEMAQKLDLERKVAEAIHKKAATHEKKNREQQGVEEAFTRKKIGQQWKKRNRWLMIAGAALIVIILSSLGLGEQNSASTPEQVVNKLFSGVQNGDGDAVVSCLSAEALAGIDEGLVEIKANPEETAGMAVMFGIEITADEVANLTAARAISLLLTSEMLAAEMPDFSTVVVGTAVIDGETATVPVTMDGETEDMELVLEDGSWKIGGGDMDFM